MAQVDYLAERVIAYLKQPGNYGRVTLINTSQNEKNIITEIFFATAVV